MKNEQHIQELHVAFTVVVSNYRGILASNSARANNGFFAPEVGSPSELSELMINSAWANEARALKALRNPYTIEKYGRCEYTFGPADFFSRQFKIQFSQFLVSTAARSSGCYLKCNTQPNAELYCNDKRDEFEQSSILPPAT